jgi:hypothetical protein
MDWKTLENWLRGHQKVKGFSAEALGLNLQIPTEDASWLIQQYLREQRRPGTTAKFVLKRKGRTRNATWSVGQAAPDAQAVGVQFADDTYCRVRRAVRPDMERIARISPSTARKIDLKLDAVERALLDLVAAVNK